MIASFWNDTERPRYQAAARRFRQPYWDFAAPPPEGESVLPWSVGGSQYVDVDGPNGRQRIANPLYTYYFRPLDPDAFTFGPVSFFLFSGIYSGLASLTHNEDSGMNGQRL